MAAERDEVETILSSILASQKDGLTLQGLDEEYQGNVGTRIPYQELGYDTLAEFLESMPQVVSLQIAEDGEIVAHAAYNALTAHVTKMVAEQKPAPFKARRQRVQGPFFRNVHPYHKASRGGGFARGPAHPVPAAQRQPPAKFSAARRKPLLELPGNVERFSNRQYFNRPGAIQKRRSLKLPMPGTFMYGNGWRASNVMAWTSFLVAAGVVRQRANVYARLLMWHGATPSSLWLFTGQDIFHMGICDYHDIRMIQEHAHRLHAMHRSSVMAEDGLGVAGQLGTFDEEQDGFHGSKHGPMRRNKRRVYARGYNDDSVTSENECWLEDDRLHLTPPLRRTRMLKLKHGFFPTPLNLRSVVGGSSIKQRLGWHN